MMNSHTESPSATLLQGLRILYVEDDPDTLRELGRFLKKRVGFLSTASNGIEALEACSKVPVDIVITDLRMPGMDGLVFVRALRESGSRCPVIITSAFSDSETILQAVDLGIVKYCIKPLNTSELLLTLERLASDRLKEAGVLIQSGTLSLDRQQKLECEKQIRSEVARLLKNLTGKGPKDVQAILGTSAIDICITEGFTLLELTLLSNRANAGLIAYLRKTLYTEARQEFEACIGRAAGVPVSLEDIETDIPGRTDRLTLRL